ncbi:MAG: ABC transporter permease [Deltaproteobacteria bacterium]|nr:ABC transporter permease [Deltaproteobacteria bacterium]
MSYSFQIGVRYLRSKKRATVSMITLISIIGVALGVAALLAVLSITTGFERAFRDKVLGVNAHVLVLKYGREFRDYRDVLATVGEMAEVAGIAPFSINEMMLTKGERRGVVLVKGVTPEGLHTVLDLPHQMVAGNLEGLRRPGSVPTRSAQPKSDEDWQWLRDIRDGKPQQRDTAPAEGANNGHGREGVGAQDGDPALGDAEPTRRKTFWEEEKERREAQREAERRARRPNIGKVAKPGDIEAMLDGLDGDDFALPDDPEWEAGLSQGEAQEPVNALPGIIVGKTLAEDIGLEVGDRVRLISPLAALGITLSEPGGASTRSREFRVIGVFQAGFQEYDSGLVYTDLFEAQRLFDEGDNVTGVELRVHDLDTSEQLARRIEQDLGGAFHSLDWSELNRNLFTALEVQKIALTLVIATIIFVAAFNVIATLIMIVIEKKREIAILKAMGATDATVLGIFMLQGVVVGVIGTFAGVLVGGGLVVYLDKIHFPLDPKVYLIDHLPLVLDPTVFLITIGIALLICTVSTIAPSWWAARMLPVDPFAGITQR